MIKKYRIEQDQPSSDDCPYNLQDRQFFMWATIACFSKLDDAKKRCRKLTARANFKPIIHEVD